MAGKLVSEAREKTYNEILIDAIKHFFPPDIQKKYIEIVEREREMAISEALAHMHQVHRLESEIAELKTKSCGVKE